MTIQWSGGERFAGPGAGDWDGPGQVQRKKASRVAVETLPDWLSSDLYGSCSADLRAVGSQLVLVVGFDKLRGGSRSSTYERSLDEKE